MNRRAVMLWTTLFAFVPAPAALAQSPLLITGATVEFVIKGDTVTHRSRDVIATPDSLIVSGCADCAGTRFALDDFAKLDVLVHPKRGPVASAVGGAVLGLLGGAILGVGIGALFDKQHCTSDCRHGLPELAGVIVGAPAGAVVGLTIGALRGRDRWHHIIPAA